jgi:uncharacterized protein YdeI (YjbR/CyaY-like superfamily)
VPAVIETERFDKVTIASLNELRAWLAANHASTQSFWLVRWKKATPNKFIDRLAVLNELICWGWNDGLARKRNDLQTMQLIGPRKQQAWAQTYKNRAARLESEGRMQAPGRAAIARSKKPGLWNASAEVDQLVVPRDLAAHLSANPTALQFYRESAPSYRRNLLRWLACAKKPETRHRRINAIVETSSLNKKVPQMGVIQPRPWVSDHIVRETVFSARFQSTS